MTLRRIALTLAVAGALAGCGFARVDVPISFRADRRLELTAPADADEVGLPATVRWRVKGAVPKGTQFALFVDKPPVPPGEVVRVRICGEQEKLPPQPGEPRGECHDDRDRVVVTDTPTHRFTCFRPKFDAPRRNRHRYTVTVVLVDRDGRRTGLAASHVTFTVRSQDARRCRGLDGPAQEEGI